MPPSSTIRRQFWKAFAMRGRPLHRKKKVREFPVPSRDVTTKLSLGGNNDVITEVFLPRGSLVSDILAGDGKLVNLFSRCTVLFRSFASPRFFPLVLSYSPYFRPFPTLYCSSQLLSIYWSHLSRRKEYFYELFSCSIFSPFFCSL